MNFTADLHIHSRFARACSKELNIPNLASWGKIKGIDILGTGDCLHPLWLSEMASLLKEDGSGLLSLDGSSTKCILTTEVSSIYSHKGKTRRVHNVLLFPNFESVRKMVADLSNKRAKLASDGRPIVGISSRDLLELALNVDPKIMMIPAHAWTPWFGVFGSESGYDSLKECFEDLSGNIFAVETGLSSDPAMNWRIGELDNLSIISCSDAHSLPNLGREATVFNLSELTYDNLTRAIKAGDGSRETVDKISHTIEFYPEEGKYHYSGHRNCQVRLSPDEIKANGKICPVCGKGLTIGVMERVEEIAARSSDELRVTSDESKIIKSQTQPGRPGYQMLVPLLQIISESLQVGITSQKVLSEYKKLTEALGGEIGILSQVDLKDISRLSGEKMAEGVSKARRGDLVIEPGFDGVYGVVKIWAEEKKLDSPQIGLFEK